MSHPHIHLYGQSQPPSAPWRLRAGPLEANLDPDTGFLRGIRHNQVEWVRGVYAAVRDANWETVPGTISWIRREIGEADFHLEWTRQHRRGELAFEWSGTIQGSLDGTIEYRIQGTALSRFQKNRIGFCVLHPIRECAGTRARQFRSSGSQDSRFPYWIEPQIFGQATFTDLRAISYEVAADTWVQVEFEGDVFEMEDQRNWTDASFKTYCTPLARPFPVWMESGQRIEQKVRIQPTKAPDDWQGPMPESSRTGLSTRTVAVIEAGVPDALVLPEVPEWTSPQTGFCLPSDRRVHTLRERELIRRLQPAHLRVDLKAYPESNQPDPWEQVLKEAAQECEAMRTPLELVLHASNTPVAMAHDWLQQVRRTLEQLGTPIERILVYQQGTPATPREVLQLTRQVFQSMETVPPIGGGSDCNFCEWNREHALLRFDVQEADFVAWSINPQVHTFDHASILETVEAQPATVHTARHLAPGRPLGITPITLKQRFNPVATGAEPSISVSPEVLPVQVDTRQLSLFNAAWTLAGWMQLGRAGAAFLTYFETVGWKGLCERAEGSPLPDLFPSIPGKFFPVYQAFEEIAGWPQGATVDCSEGLAACVLYRNSERRLLVVNLTDKPRTLTVSHPEWLEQPHLFGENNAQKIREIAAYSFLVQDYRTANSES